MSDYPYIWAAIKFHKLEQFTSVRRPYVLKWVREFYDTYAKTFPMRRKGIVWKTIDKVEVRGKMVQCRANEINTVLCTPSNHGDEYMTRIHKRLDALKGYWTLYYPMSLLPLGLLKGRR